ncbi:polysaccharide deacetylase family protein [Lacinutrix sp. C3R15]|uniref:polysaccharide deacetylase family protein n=1 Tax=Flavobacteriaceae TaxID=49546 RepID=UPI001C083CF9|nr:MULTISPECIES: polysaccharide deacetylase family protein [Flavobacteriaceae]MBU2939358.1 polysaccharide deacetylase family protein [Lacinutrix sp. C3R15]MDO6622673.1 polysaccharide deacetylase family protein [Oceanihabitans sp. 1_MG-2023]
MLLVYTHKITPRVKYVFKHICTRILGLPVTFTTTIEEFIGHDSLKISYTKQPLSHEIFIRSHDLLFEQGLSDVDINVQNWEDTKGFFAAGDKSVLPYDVFAASFYLLSRYEEYLPHVKDDYGRFTAEESLAYKHHFLQQPIVDVWAYKFKKILQENYPDFQFATKQYQVIPVIDVPEAFTFKNKGLMRSFGGTLHDLVSFKFKRLYTRFSVLFGFKRDTYDTFKYILNKQKQTKFKFVFFFLIGDYSTYDKNININKTQFVSLIKQVSDYSIVGLKASYFAISNFKILKKEKEKLEAVINTSLLASRNSFSKLNLPDTYRNLVELEVPEDYTMGFVNHIGFRAGTCTPFFFYDLDYEVQTPLKIYSYHLLDYALFKTNSLLDKKKVLNQVIHEIKKVNGCFIPVFHNYTFSDVERWHGFKELFNIIIESPNHV